VPVKMPVAYKWAWFGPTFSATEQIMLVTQKLPKGKSKSGVFAKRA